MSCNACACNAGLGNTGTTCSPLQKSAYKYIGVPLYDDDGNRNGIDLENDTLNQAYFDALVNQTDKSKRWFPYPAMKNVEDVRGENQTEEFSDKTKIFVSEGTRSSKSWIVGSDAQPVLKEKIESGRCREMGYMVVDLSGNLIGSFNSDKTFLYPIQIVQDTLSARWIKPTDSTTQKIELMFDWHPSERDENLGMITCSELGDVNLLTIKGLLDICAVVESITVTGFKVTLKTSYGTALNPVLDKGLVITDFVSSDTGATGKIFNETTQADVTITSVTESPDGVYTFVIPAQSFSDVLILKPLKNGRDYQCVVDAPISMPVS